MKLYLAAPYAARDYIREEVAPTFRAHGHELVSGWLNGGRPITAGTINTAPDTPLPEVAHHARLDLAEVAEAEVLVLFSGPYLSRAMGIHRDYTTSGGRHVEMGYALALGIPVLVVGDPENIFGRALTAQVPDVAEALRFLDRQERLLAEVEASRVPPAGELPEGAVPTEEAAS